MRSGMTYAQCMKLIVLPQAFRNMLPVLLTQTIILFQDTSLVYAIGAYDLLKGFEVAGKNFNRPVETYLVAAVVYFVICFSLSMLVRRCRRRSPSSADRQSGHHMIDIKNVSKWYGSFQVLTDCTTAIKKGEVVVVCGPSGSGKSTLIKTVNALEPFQKGDIVVDGISIADPKTNLPKLRSRVGMVFQHFELFPHLTVTENLTLAQIKVLDRIDGRGQDARPEDARPRRPDGAQGQVPRPALRRPAAARGDRARAQHGPDRDAVRRADLGARPRDGRRGARRDGQAGRRRHDDDGRHARDGLRHARSATA